MPGCVRQAWLDLDGTTIQLDDPAGGWFCTSLDFGFPVVRDVVANRPDQNGIFDRTQYFGSRVITANLIAIAGAGAQIDQVAAAFAPYLLPTVRPVLHYVLDRPGTPERTLTVRGSGYSWPVAGPYQRDILLQFVAADPVAYDPAGQVAATLPGSSTTISTSGDLPARPLFRITGPITHPIITLTPSPPPAWTLAFLSSFTIAAGHYIDIDTNARTVLLDGDPTKPRLSSVDWTVSSWQWIPPAPSSTTMALTGTSTTGATLVTATWQDGYLA